MSYDDDEWGGACGRCGRSMVPRDAWLALTPEQRAAFRAAGLREQRRTGLCNGCWAWLNARGMLEAYAPTVGPTEEARAKSCTRCGLEGTVDGKLCRDCADVTFDLDEREAWA